MMTGFTPYSSQETSGSAPYRTYAQARTKVMVMAGRMKHAPATSSPRQPARRSPRWIAISVEFGPGIRLVAPSRSRNRSRVSQPRLRTTSSSIMAMCAAGPPKAIVPSFRKRRATSPTRDGVCPGSPLPLSIVPFSPSGASRTTSRRSGSEGTVAPPMGVQTNQRRGRRDRRPRRCLEEPSQSRGVASPCAPALRAARTHRVLVIHHPRVQDQHLAGDAVAPTEFHDLPGHVIPLHRPL